MMSNEINSDTAKMLFKEGAIFVLLDMPEGSEFGIDYNSWTTGPNFRGVKMIPPGIHYIYYRTGFFRNFKQREIVVRKWDRSLEEDVSQADKERVEGNLQELDQYLGAYPYENYKKWISLTSHISEELLGKLQPECGAITSVTQFLSPPSNSEMRRQSAETLAQQENTSPSDTRKKKKLPQLQKVPGTAIRFTKIPKQRYPEGATPQQITVYSMDSTFMLDSIIQSDYSKNKRGILGEIQFAFICFLIGQVFDAFDQWKKLVHLMCGSEKALNSHSDLFMDFIAMLHFQVHEIPEDFFVDIVSANNFLTTTLQEFFSNLEAGNGDIKLRERGLKFRDHLTRKFKWDFTTEPDDYAPVIVDS
ncbi:AAR2-like protein [Mya arenaria]|uniref:Protein AAR2 homolog n=1 Tax=Mya arenaria TaxID=6604 RepID=A0ABY7E672_MYAAR|nr:AAR2-like protein [Mya arenaria]